MKSAVSPSLSLSLAAFLASDAFAQAYPNPRTSYFLIDLGVTESCSNRVVIFPTSLNDCGDVVGYTNDDQNEANGCGISPWIWSLCGRFGLDPQSIYLLNEMAGLTGQGRAWGINNDGDVVGEQVTANDVSAPYVWRFGSSGLSSDFEIGSGVKGVARGVSESDGSHNAHVVGTRFANVSGTVTNRGFYHVLGSSTTSMSILDPLSGDTSSGAFACALASAANTPPRVGGVSATTLSEVGFNGAGAEESGGGGSTIIDCDADGSVNAVRWSASGSPVTPVAVREDFASGGPLDLDEWNARMYAIDELGQGAGAYVDPVVNCRSRGVFWRADGTVIDLGLISPLTVGSETEALGMAPADSTGGSAIVGGRDHATDLGVIWWRASGSGGFEVTIANQLHLNDCPWTIQSIADVNRNGWICATALHNTYSHAVLLIPYACPADVDFSGSVDATDLAIMIGSWGSCGTGSQCGCLSDLDYSGDVGSSDIAILLGAWATSCTIDFCAGCTNNTEAAAQSTTQNPAIEIATLLSMFGQQSIEGFSTWTGELSPTARAQLAENLSLLGGNGQGGDL